MPGRNGAREMEVVVDQARDDGGARDIDYPGLRADVAGHLCVGAACDDATLIDGEGVDYAKVRIDRENPAVRDDRVGHLLRKRGRARQQRDKPECGQQCPVCKLHVLSPRRIRNQAGGLE
jgi:hypothetical protein